MALEEKAKRVDELKNKISELSLDNISKDMIDLCEKIVSDDRFWYNFDLLDDGRVSLKTNINRKCYLDREILCVEEMMSALNDNKIYQKRPVFKAKGESGLFINFKHDNLTVCKGCSLSECIPSVLGRFIVYKEKGILDKKLAEVRNNNVPFFKFNWEPQDGLRCIPEDVYQIALEIFNKNRVWVNPRLDADGFVCIYFTTACEDANFLNKQWFEDFIDFKDDFCRYFTRNLNCDLTNLCGNLVCGLNYCPFLIAAYLYYLTKAGRGDQIIKDREYYKANESKILSKAKPIIHTSIEETKNKSHINEQVFNKMSRLNRRVENADMLAFTVANKRRKNLCFAIEREDGIDDQLTIDLIKSSLTDMSKIETTRVMSLYKLSCLVNERDEQLSDNCLYVITEPYSYVKENQNVANVNRLVDALCAFAQNKYVLVVGTHDEFYGPKGLFAIDPKVKYVYEHFKVKINNLTIEDLYSLYKSLLDTKVMAELYKDEKKFKNEFNNFVIGNRSLFPFKNEELAKYLARYSNLHGEIVFPPYAYKFQTLDESMKNIVGLESVKLKMKELEQYILFTNKIKSMGGKVPDANLHMIFNGNPGTGKTMVARIMTRMLYDIGAIRENNFVEVSRKDLVAEWIGQTAPKTNDVINKAMGGVLFIDEAYQLTPTNNDRDYGPESVATIMKAMDDHRGEFVVIFAGYEDEMRKFVNSNPGLSSRIGYTFNFDDYGVDELWQIMDQKLKDNGFHIKDDFILSAKELIEISSRRMNFGNGRFIDKLVQETLMQHSTMLDGENLFELTKRDLPSMERLSGEYDKKGDVKSALDNLIGMKDLKDKIYEFIDYVTFTQKAKYSGLNIPDVNMHMLFTGNPGTGKTTTARIMTKMLYDIGVLHENKLVEVERKDLVGEYIGQTAPKTSEILDKAMGGVLFIDEAYSLTPKGNNDFGQEAIATIVKAMEDRKGDIIIIFAGYKDEMLQFVDSNPGIASRIGYTFDFPDYEPEELLDIYEMKMKKAGFTLLQEAKDEVLKLMRYFGRVENIGNGRFVDRVIQNTIIKHSRKQEISMSVISAKSIPTIDETIKTLSNSSNLLKPGDISENSVRRTAVHEIGHAYIRYKLFKDPQILKITINAEGCGTLGYVKYDSDKKATHSKTDLLNNIQVLLAGMGSEEIFYGEFENGNVSDLEKATNIARNMVTKYGMSKIGIAHIENDSHMAVKINEEVNDILGQCYETVKEIVQQNKEEISKLVDYLVEHKELNGDEFLQVISNLK